MIGGSTLVGIAAPEFPSGDSPDRPRSKRQPLYIRMYFDKAVTELTRLIGYQGMPAPEAAAQMQPLITQFGKAKMQEVAEEIVTIDHTVTPPVARLTAEARKLAFQLLGPPPPQTPAPSPPSAVKASTSTNANPPLILRQYREAKEGHPGMLLLFRVGDFYECFEDDARQAAKLLGLTLTMRDRTIAMAGFPHHALETHLQRLLKSGARVAICDQVQDPASVAGQPVARVVLPGSLAEETPTPPQAKPVEATDPSLQRLNKRQLGCRLRDARRGLAHNGKRSVAGKAAKKTIAAVEAEIRRRGLSVPPPGEELRLRPADPG